jgi:hypothetical protein
MRLPYVALPSGERKLRAENLLKVRRALFRRHVRQALGTRTEVLTGLFEHLSQNVYLHELFADNVTEPLGM